ncbi:MAG TPA: hypothetical protein EYP86_04525 [Candidatus Altiarchaeales archaeon]|nr:hypothetical protein [Candidatus Altiarchaeales archaeon]
MLIELLKLVEDKKITENTGKKILERIIDSGESPEVIVRNEGLLTVRSEDKLSSIVDSVIEKNQEAIKDYLSGKREALNYLMGQVMREMRGRADPSIVIKLLKGKIEK